MTTKLLQKPNPLIDHEIAENPFLVPYARTSVFAWPPLVFVEPFALRIPSGTPLSFIIDIPYVSDYTKHD